MITAGEIALAIRSGELDDNLDAIAARIRGRKSVLAEMKKDELSAGDVIEFSSTIRPRYLAGLTAEVVRVNPVNVVVKCPIDHRYRRYSGARNVTLSPNLIGRKLDV